MGVNEIRATTVDELGEFIAQKLLAGRPYGAIDIDELAREILQFLNAEVRTDHE